MRIVRFRIKYGDMNVVRYVGLRTDLWGRYPMVETVYTDEEIRQARKLRALVRARRKNARMSIEGMLQ